MCCKKYISEVFFISLLSLCITSPAYSKDYKVDRGTVTKVIDGDTVIIRPVSGKLIKCRLYGIDAPEMPYDGHPGQAYGRAADRELNNLVLHTTVEITLTGESSYDREICIIKKTGVDINREMVRHGYAWAYRKHLKEPYTSEYIDAENEARKMHRGLWQLANPRPPWEFRKHIPNLR
ncbi:MAG: thermonuclease family protein [Nitrospirae bacterium]|nr:thermonuclease family protein [Nitrospirota bacterium]